jgi:hypothetical protein
MSSGVLEVGYAGVDTLGLARMEASNQQSFIDFLLDRELVRDAGKLSGR